MQKDEIKIYLAEMLSNGVSLSDIQKQLRSEKGVTMTFLDLRLIASEIENVDWSKQEPEEKQKEAKKDEPEKGALQDEKDELTGTADQNEAAPVGGATVVEVSKLTRPGTIANGSVKFGSGVKANWMIDQYNRLGLDKPTGEPTPQDIKEFQVELQKLLSHGR